MKMVSHYVDLYKILAINPYFSQSCNNSDFWFQYYGLQNFSPYLIYVF